MPIPMPTLSRIAVSSKIGPLLTGTVQDGPKYEISRRPLKGLRNAAIVSDSTT
jgi:hypothetical protein